MQLFQEKACEVLEKRNPKYKDVTITEKVIAKLTQADLRPLIPKLTKFAKYADGGE